MTCTGRCCAEFWLTKGVQLEIMGGQDADAYTTREMLIPLGNDQFTCKHWDRKTLRCGIYEDRPQMCKDFPAKGRGKGCGREGCTL